MSYRDASKDLPPRERDVRWRVQVARAAQLLFWALLVRALFGSLLHLPATAVITWLWWQLSASRPLSETPARSRLRGWLRALALGALALGVLYHWNPFVGPAGVHSSAADAWSSVLLLVHNLLNTALDAMGLLYVGTLFREFGAAESEDRSRRVTRNYVISSLVVYAATFYTATQVSLLTRVFVGPDPQFLRMAFKVAGAIAGITLFKAAINILQLLQRLRATLRVTAHEWWFKPGTGWASLALAQQNAEVIEPTGARAVFADGPEAEAWLRDNDYVSGDRAVAEHIVLSAPQPVVVPEQSSQPRSERPSESRPKRPSQPPEKRPPRPRQRVAVDSAQDQVDVTEGALDSTPHAERARARQE